MEQSDDEKKKKVHKLFMSGLALFVLPMSDPVSSALDGSVCACMCVFYV